MIFEWSIAAVAAFIFISIVISNIIIIIMFFTDSECFDSHNKIQSHSDSHRLRTRLLTTNFFGFKSTLKCVSMCQKLRKNTEDFDRI